MSDAFILLDNEFRVAYLNPVAERAVQATAGDLIGRSHWEAWPATVGSEIERRYRLAMSSGQAQHFQDHYIGDRLDLWLEIHAYPSIVGLAVYFRDVTEQKREEERLARIERSYKAALSNTPDLVYVFGLDHRFTYANEALLTMWGRTWDEAIGKNCLELGYPDWHAAMHDREIEQVVATGEPIRGEVYFAGTHGRRLYEYIFVPVRGAHGEVEAVAGTTRDLTERQQAEEALRQSEKLAVAGRLAASISHEINNPLEAVTNLLYLIEGDRSLAPETRGYLETAQAELARVSHIATQTLRFHRRSASAGPTQIKEILASAVALYRRRLRDAEVTLTEDYCDSGPIAAFASELRQVFANLLGNALDAAGHKGRIVLRERSATDWRNRRKGVRVTVTDSGHGMSGETVQRAFDPFFTTKSATGTGLGLWVTKEIVEKHGGTIRVRSRQKQPYRGTIVSVYIPDLSAEK